MFKPLSLFMGLRYTRARRRNHVISFMSLSSMIGLMLGVGVLITVLSVMNGFDRELRQRILGMVSHAVVTAPTPLAQWPGLVALAEATPGVKAAAPLTQVQGMLTANGRVSGVMVSGIVPEQERKVSLLPTSMAVGRLEDLAPREFGIVLGRQLADSLGVQQGDSLTLVLPEASLTAAGIIPRFKRFTVVGIFQVGAEVDALLAYVHLEDAALLLRTPGRAQSIRLSVDDLFQARATTERVLNQLPAGFYGQDWTFTQGTLFNAIQMEKAMMSLLLLLIVAVAAFNIVSSLVMVVNDKRADIAILRTLGASPGLVQRIFLVQGMTIGIGGTLAGIALGITLSLSVTDIVRGIEWMTGEALFDAYFINYLPSYLRWQDVLWVGAAGFIMSLLATIYPARQAGRVQPAEALRYE